MQRSLFAFVTLIVFSFAKICYSCYICDFVNESFAVAAKILVNFAKFAACRGPSLTLFAFVNLIVFSFGKICYSCYICDFVNEILILVTCLLNLLNSRLAEVPLCLCHFNLFFNCHICDFVNEILILVTCLLILLNSRLAEVPLCLCHFNLFFNSPVSNSPLLLRNRWIFL